MHFWWQCCSPPHHGVLPPPIPTRSIVNTKPSRPPPELHHPLPPSPQSPSIALQTSCSQRTSLNTLLPVCLAGLSSARFNSQKVLFGAMKTSGTVLHAPDSAYCTPLHALMRFRDRQQRTVHAQRIHTGGDLILRSVSRQPTGSEGKKERIT